MTFDEYFKKYNGVGIDYDGKWSFQCFDLANHYCVNVLGGKAFVGMYAWEIYENFNNQPSKNLFTRIPNTPEFIPQKGDIIVWAKSLNGKAGHVAICDGVGDTTYFYSYEENWDGKCHPTERVKHNYNHVLGVLRPKDQTKVLGTTETKGEKKMTKLKGIDISRYQGSPDFSKVKNEVDYVIVQAGYGRYTNQKDSSFERNYSECKKHGIPVGLYWFSYALSVADAKKEAETCLEVIKGKQFEYPIYFDIEGSALSGDVSGKCKAFCDVIEKAGYFAGIYISRSPAQTYLNKDVASRYALWLAEYSPNCNYNGDYGMWQYSSTGKINGISGDVDMNYCYVDYPAIIKSVGLNGYKKQTASENATTTTTTSEVKTLDSAGFKKGDKGYQALAFKSLLKLAVDKKIVEGKMDDTSGIGNGCIKVINALLKKWGYKQTGVAGTNFINKLYKELK